MLLLLLLVVMLLLLLGAHGGRQLARVKARGAAPQDTDLFSLEPLDVLCTQARNKLSRTVAWTHKMHEDDLRRARIQALATELLTPLMKEAMTGDQRSAPNNRHGTTGHACAEVDGRASFLYPLVALVQAPPPQPHQICDDNSWGPAQACRPI